MFKEAAHTAFSSAKRWVINDVNLVPFDNGPGEHEKNLIARYPVPEEKRPELPPHMVMGPVIKRSYRARMHEFLHTEEVAQQELLSQYDAQGTLWVTDRFNPMVDPASTKIAGMGELFAQLTMPAVVSGDYAAGRLLLDKCSTLLFATTESEGDENRKVYEAAIEDKGKTVIYIRLSKNCVKELNLKSGEELEAEVQFQLNRLHLCEMHDAIDKLHPLSSVAPDLCRSKKKPWSSRQANLNLGANLSSRQRRAILAITTPLSVCLPPLLIMGPFGVGKTYTLAQAVKILLDQPDSRILVCTHSNSAADIYIREYLHPCVAEGKTEATPLRIYDRHSRVDTVHPTVQQYCLISQEGVDRCFGMPTIEDVKRRKVVVTTLGAVTHLLHLGLEKGFFTHILIDEAAQATECETIMPLTLANENTRIALAGDPMQLSPEIFSLPQNFGATLLMRLYVLYKDCVNFPCKFLLRRNYQSHEAIRLWTMLYTSHKLTRANQPSYSPFYPLSFFSALGEDIEDPNSTGFYNDAEVNEVVKRVIEVKKRWPKAWGVQDEDSIAVITPYCEQVTRIRAELDKGAVNDVSVQTVCNVQGKQFRVVFLSVVRTRQTCGGRTEDIESDLDHGFLSNEKLVITAITRAQSLVAVVGDPMSMWSVGKCRELWQNFIWTCHENGSLYGCTWPIRPGQPTASNVPRMPHKNLGNQGPTNFTEVKELEESVPVGRPLKRNAGHLPFPIIINKQQPMVRLHKEPLQKEGKDIHVAQGDSEFHFQNKLTTMNVEKHNKMLSTPKSDELGSSLPKKQRFEREIQNVPCATPIHFEEQNNVMMKTSFNEMNSCINDAERPLVNLPHQVFHSSSSSMKLSALEKYLPPGTDTSVLLDNEDLVNYLAQHLLMLEGPSAVSSFRSILASIKNDQEEFHKQQLNAQKKFMNRSLCFPSCWDYCLVPQRSTEVSSEIEYVLPKHVLERLWSSPVEQGGPENNPLVFHDSSNFQAS